MSTFTDCRCSAAGVGSARHQSDGEITSSTGSLPATDLDQVGVTGLDADGDAGHEVRSSTAIVSTGETASSSRAAGGAVIDDQHAVAVGSGLCAGVNGGDTIGTGRVEEPVIVRHIGITVGRAVGGSSAGVVGVNAFADRVGSAAIVVAAVDASRTVAVITVGQAIAVIVDTVAAVGFRR